MFIAALVVLFIIKLRFKENLFMILIIKIYTFEK